MKLVTLIITTCRNVKFCGQKWRKWLDVMSLEINSSHLILLTFNELSRIVTSDEFSTIFLVLKSTNISNRITRNQLFIGTNKKHIKRNQENVPSTIKLYTFNEENMKKRNKRICLWSKRTIK